MRTSSIRQFCAIILYIFLNELMSNFSPSTGFQVTDMLWYYFIEVTPACKSVVVSFYLVLLCNLTKNTLILKKLHFFVIGTTKHQEMGPLLLKLFHFGQKSLLENNHKLLIPDQSYLTGARLLPRRSEERSQHFLHCTASSVIALLWLMLGLAAVDVTV